MSHSWIQNMLIPQAAEKEKKGDLTYLPKPEFHLITFFGADFIPGCSLGSEKLFCTPSVRT